MINWIAGALCLFMFYISGLNLLSLFVLFDGIYNTFTKWHIISILVSLTTLLFGTFGIFWFSMCLGMLAVVNNWEKIRMFFELIKKSVSLASKMSSISSEPEMTKDIKALESINSKIVWITQKYEIIMTHYDQKIKNRIVKYTNVCIESAQWKYFMNCVEWCNLFISSVFDTMGRNAVLLYSVLQNVYIVKIIKSKYDDWCEMGRFTYDLVYSDSNGSDTVTHDVTTGEKLLFETNPMTNMSIENQTQMANDFLNTLATMMNEVPIDISKNNTTNFDNMFVDFQNMLGCEIGDLTEKKISLRQKNKKPKRKHR